jgi:hypothetical protein
MMLLILLLAFFQNAQQGAIEVNVEDSVTGQSVAGELQLLFSGYDFRPCP